MKETFSHELDSFTGSLGLQINKNLFTTIKIFSCHNPTLQSHPIQTRVPSSQTGKCGYYMFLKKWENIYIYVPIEALINRK